MDQHSVTGRTLAVERIRVGAGGRHGGAGVCAIPLISAGDPAPADAVDETDAVRVAAWYALSGLYALSLPFWMSGTMSQLINQSIQRSTAQNPEVSPPPAEVISTITAMMSGVLWIAAIIGVVISVVIIIGALNRWTWMFYVVLVFLGLGAISLPFNIIGALAGSTALNPYSLPVWVTWLSVVLGIPSTALFVWMLVAVTRYGPWAMTRKVESPQMPQPATG